MHFSHFSALIQTPRQSPGDHRSSAASRDQSMGPDRGQTRDRCEREPVLWPLSQSHEHPGTGAATL